MAVNITPCFHLFTWGEGGDQGVSGDEHFHSGFFHDLPIVVVSEHLYLRKVDDCNGLPSHPGMPLFHLLGTVLQVEHFMDKQLILSDGIKGRPANLHLEGAVGVSVTQVKLWECCLCGSYGCHDSHEVLSDFDSQ